MVQHDNVVAAPSVREAIELAKNLTPAAATICITGSLYLVGEAMAALKSDMLTETFQ